MIGCTRPRAPWCAPRTRSNISKSCASTVASPGRPPMASIPEVEIFTDGACSGNPGPGGWGAILRYGETEKELAGGEPATTNNRMELTAAIAALEALKRPCRVRL